MNKAQPSRVDYAALVKKAWAGKYTKWQAIMYFVKHDQYTNEWSGAGMWEAVLTVMKSVGSEVDKKYLDDLLEKAKNF